MTIKYAIFSLVLCLGISPQGQADDAVSISVKEEGFTGTFYSGDGTTDRVGVMVLGGSEGGTPKRDAKRFADAGYPALAVERAKGVRSLFWQFALSSRGESTICQ